MIMMGWRKEREKGGWKREFGEGMHKDGEQGVGRHEAGAGNDIA